MLRRTETRRTEEALVITLPDGRSVRLVVCRVRGSTVRLGIQAPPDVRVERGERAETPPGHWYAREDLDIP